MVRIFESNYGLSLEFMKIYKIYKSLWILKNKYLETFFLSLFTLLCFVNPNFAQELNLSSASATLPTIQGARVSTTSERARLVLDLSASSKFALASFVETGKNRIAVDVKASNYEIKSDVIPSGEGIISSVFIEKAEEGRIRIWLNLADWAQVQQAYVLEPFDNQPARLVVDIAKTSEDVFKQNAANDINYSSGEKTNQANLGDHSTAAGALNIKLQRKAFIVIDPGHGGVDGGASTSNGIREKDIVLDFAKELQSLLVASGAFEVALTRSDDSFLRLEERVDLARLNKADLFISIHADSFLQSEVNGTSIYTRDEEATDVLDKVLASSENMSDIVAGFSPPNMDKHAVSVLVDLMRREMRKKSYIAANSIVDQLRPSISLRRYPIRQADFFVLQSPDVPSILIELGFLSNSVDAKNLTTTEWQSRVSKAIARGVAIYFDNNAQE